MGGVAGNKNSVVSKADIQMPVRMDGHDSRFCIENAAERSLSNVRTEAATQELGPGSLGEMHQSESVSYALKSLGEK